MKKLLTAIVVLAAVAGSAYAYVSSRHVLTPLTGEAAPGNIPNRRPIAVILDTYSPDARPQSGLDRADMVFETLAEGGITRFLAIYQHQDAPVIGPVRSTRLYFNSWAAGLGVIFGHDGGNVDALQQLPHLASIYNIDADRTFGPFYRVNTRLIPHNEYTSTAALRSFAAAHGGSTTGTPPSFPFKADAPPSQRPAHFTLSIDFSYGPYNVQWQYDPSANDYLRFMGGSPHVDAITGKQLTAKNIVVMRTAESPDQDPFTPGSIRLKTEGSGPVTVYRDGQAIAGTWNKSSVEAPLRWLGPDGQPIQLDRGTTWVEVVPNGNQVSTS
jgi:hypothetical protein